MLNNPRPNTASSPVVCTLGPDARKARREDLLGVLVRRAAERVELPDGYRIRFSLSDDLLPTIAMIINVERHCCRFLTFRVTVLPDAGPVWLELTGPPGTKEFLAGLLDL